MSAQYPVVDERAGPEHGLPNRTWIYYGMLAPPAFWAFQEWVNYGVASHACFPFNVPLPNFLPPMGWTWWFLLGVNLGCLLGSAVGLYTSYRSWRRLLRPRERREEDEHDNILEPGEGRIRAFAAAGLLISMLFTIAILANLESIGAISTCSRV